MVRKDDYSISNEDSPVAVLQDFVTGTNRRNVVFVSSSAETLVYTFVLAFYLTRGPEDNLVRLIVSDDLYTLTKRLIRPVLYKRYSSQIDPFVERLIGSGTINFIESQRVYPLSSLKHFDPNQKIIVFVTERDILSDSLAQARIRNSDVIIAGRDALSDETPKTRSSYKPRLTLRVASPDWSFHSSEEDLVALIKELSGIGVKTILFHNYPNNISRFIKRTGLPPDMVFPLSKSGILLSKDV